MGYRAVLAMILGSGAVAAAVPAAAQGEAALRGELRACAKIAEIGARVACYDALSAGEEPAPPAAAEPRGLGSEQIPRERAPQPERVAAQAETDSIEATVAASVEREPGIHLVTLEDGAQWQFVEGVPLSYNPPRRGASVEIRSASMGSYLMRYQGQAAVRVRRVR